MLCGVFDWILVLGSFNFGKIVYLNREIVVVKIINSINLKFIRFLYLFCVFE